MYIARLLYPVKVLGPGKRIGIWFDGCPRRCRGCSNPELWEFDGKYNTSLDTVKSLIREISDRYSVEGFTLTGGDPFYQYEDLRALIDYIKTISSDILVYTGYKYEELKGKDLSGISVLIDGEYIEEQNEGLILRGSSNQRIIILDKNFENRYKEYLKEESKVQNFNTGSAVISAGIHKAEFKF